MHDEIRCGSIRTTQSTTAGAVSRSTSTRRKIPTVEVVLTILRSGPWGFGGGGCKVSGGLHGVGISVVNALSSRGSAGAQGGQEYFIGFDHGKTSKLRPVGYEARQRHDRVVLADQEIFTETTVYDFDTLANRFREMAFATRALKIVLYDRPPRPTATALK